MRHSVFIILAWLLALLLCDSATAISTLEDTLRDVPRVFKLPSIGRPNNAVHPIFGRTRAGTNNNLNNNSHAQPLIPDEGPKPDDVPESVPASAFPWVVAIAGGENLQEDYVCAGVVIDPTWILTAAHCAFHWMRRWPNDVEPYVFTETDSLASPGRRFAVEEIVPHPKYDTQTLRNDIALLKIDTKAASAGPPIMLNGPAIADQAGQVGQIVGWGVSGNFLAQDHRGRLQLIQAAILDNGVCFSAPNFSALRKTGVFCAKSLLKYHDVCFRFGGSPVILIDSKGRRYLGGLVSWPAVCPADFRIPNVYIDIQSYVPWIKSVINDKARY